MPAGKETSSVLIVGNNKVTEHIGAMLDKLQYYPVEAETNAGDVRRRLAHEGFDIIIINSPLPDEPGYELATDIAENSASSVMLAVKSEIYDETRYRVEDAGVITLSKPLSPAMFESYLNLATATRRRLATLEEENRRLRARIDEIRIVNRAKWVLIEQMSMSENEAHRFIEKNSMDSRMTRREFAENIINEYEER